MSPEKQKWSMKIPESKEDTLVKGLWYLAFGLGLVGICLNVVLFRFAQKREANTSSALQTLRNFHSAQVVYAYKPGNGSYASTGAELNRACRRTQSVKIQPGLLRSWWGWKRS
ncbi:MAG: hypothetical protein HY774_11435 [Acidobacteria bacterium]|nr:hypothetical protein [Acidobacteriota bacterium]